MTQPAKDWTGRRIGALVVHYRGPRSTRGGEEARPVWICRCDCGKLVERVSHELYRAERRALSSCCPACRHKQPRRRERVAEGEINKLRTRIEELEHELSLARGEITTREYYEEARHDE